MMGMEVEMRLLILGVEIPGRVGEGVKKSLLFGVLGEKLRAREGFLEFRRFSPLATASIEIGCCPFSLSYGS